MYITVTDKDTGDKHDIIISSIIEMCETSQGYCIELISDTNIYTKETREQLLAQLKQSQHSYYVDKNKINI
jgi:hypothetical protein